MKKLNNTLTLSAIALLLMSCSGSKDDAGQAAKDGAATAGDGWDATDACALLDKAAVGAALKDKVTETSLGLVNQASGPNAATSECTYMLASGGRASLMARNSPIADNTPEAIETARKTMQATVSAFGKTVQDIPGLGKAAFFVPSINQLSVFLDDKKFVTLTISTAPNDTAKAIAVELINKIEK